MHRWWQVIIIGGCLVVALGSGGCAGVSPGPAAAPDSQTSSASRASATPTSASAVSSSPQVSTAAASLSLSDSCEGTYDHLTSAADLVNRIVDGNGTTLTADEFRNAASALTAAKARAPQVLHADLQAMSDALTGMATSVTSGGTIRGNDLADPADRYLAICTGEASGADESESSPPEPEPVRYSKNENRYLKAYAKDWDEDAAPDDALKDGRKACTKIKEKNAGFTRNRYLVNSNNDVDLAVKYLCPRYKSDLKTSKRAIYEGDYEVGSEVKPRSTDQLE